LYPPLKEITRTAFLHQISFFMTNNKTMSSQKIWWIICCFDVYVRDVRMD